MAGRYPPQWLDELRARADIVKVIGSYVTLKKNGHRYVGLCPFHNETAPSFSVDEQKQVYHCFGCKAGGSVIQFVMDIERLSFSEAVAFLADQLHICGLDDCDCLAEGKLADLVMIDLHRPNTR